MISISILNGITNLNFSGESENNFSNLNMDKSLNLTVKISCMHGDSYMVNNECSSKNCQNVICEFENNEGKSNGKINE
ncbi:hypothetical protein PIROE2DRAFT_16640 [Piromyces sp. E2]|nr:hypothetical protein PIROE2DRAFT_16640 [Piromyces sp. E2]|eukprot:OUM58161.1 hypothetical protein PIROE2DRAFT_16640 [Piromyces sp. E2]